MRHQTTIPLGALVGAVGAVLTSKVTGGFVGVVSDGFHELVVEVDRCLRCEGDVLLIECILQPHDTKTNRAMTAVGCLRGFGWVEVDVDHVVECAHCNLNRFAELFVVEVAILIEV